MEKRRHNTRHAAALAAAAAFGESLTVPTYSASSEKGSVLQSKTTTVETKSGASKSSLNLSSFPLTETAESEPKSMFGHSLGDTPSPQDTWQNNNPQMASKRNMYEDFQLWAMKTYGDSAKTKTVTRRKYNRILKILKGEEQTNAENSKFRFWVKAKGFRIGRPADRNSDSKKSDQVIYIPCSKDKRHLYETYGKSFTMRFNLNQHHKICSRVKPYKCSVLPAALVKAVRSNFIHYQQKMDRQLM